MTAFSYLIVLVSIILGLGITRLLTGLGQQIEFRDQIESYWPATTWAVVLLLVHVQTWWTLFGLREQETWTFLMFLVVLLQPVTLYLLAALILPTTRVGVPVDLRTHYFAQTRWFFGLFALLLVVSLARDLVLRSVLPDGPNVAFHGLFLALAVTGALTRREAFHRFGAATTAVLLGAYIATLFSQLQ